jgi:hypothetical protein
MKFLDYLFLSLCSLVLVLGVLEIIAGVRAW